MTERVILPREIVTTNARELTREYLSALLSLLSMDEAYKDNQDFNFFKTSIITPNGGIYLLQVQHVEGPKINFTADLAEDGETPLFV
jgi:hypothetical protein